MSLPPDPTAPEITRIFQLVQSGRDNDACAQLWDYLHPRIVAAARQRVADPIRGVVDEADVAQSAMHSLFKAAENGRLSSVRDRDELWRVLFTIMVRKAAHAWRREMAEKRGAGRVRGDSVIRMLSQDGTIESSTGSASAGFDVLADPKSVDQLTLDLVQECRERLGQLKDEQLQTIARRSMEGHAVEEIAAFMNISRAAINRKLNRIRVLWDYPPADSRG